jgi:ribosome-interacting GTPase 1
MKYSIGILTTVTLIAALVLSGCDSPSNKMENAETSVIEANRDLEIAKSEVEAELRIYRIENADRMTEYNRTIEEIKEKINNESDSEVRVRHETRLEEYETKHRELKREMDTYRVSGKENWDNFKDSFSDRMDDLGDSLNVFFTTSRTTSSRN